MGKIITETVLWQVWYRVWRVQLIRRNEKVEKEVYQDLLRKFVKF